LEVLVKEKILVIQTAFLGDSILTLPMIGKLKEKYPSSSISILCIPSSEELFRHAFSVDEVIVYDKKGDQRSFAEFLKLINKIREKKFTHIYSPHRSIRTSIIVLFSGAGSKTGFDTSALSIVYNTKIKYSKEKHEVARNLDLIGYDTSGMNWKIVPRVEPGEASMLKIDKMMDDIGTVAFAAVAPGSVWNTKIYPANYFADVIRFLREKNILYF